MSSPEHCNNDANLYYSSFRNQTLEPPSFLYAFPQTQFHSIVIDTTPENNNNYMNDKPVDERHDDTQNKLVANPFAPECSVPLPYQIGDEYGYMTIIKHFYNIMQIFWA